MTAPASDDFNQPLVSLWTKELWRLRIALVSKADSGGGGASKAAEQLHTQLMKRKYFATHYCSYARGGWNPCRRPIADMYQGLINFLHHIGKRIGVPELFPFEYSILNRQIKSRYMDIVHFHDISSAISPLTLWLLARRIPVVWTIHDVSPVTGGCLYPVDCSRYKTGCHPCPGKGHWPIDNRIIFSELLRRVKKFVLSSPNLHLNAPSAWIANLVETSGMTTKKVKVIPNGVDLQEFRFLDKVKLRERLGLPQNRPIIAVCGLEGRKGFVEAVEVLKEINPDLAPLVIVFGYLAPASSERLEGLDYMQSGYVTGHALNQVYACADLFLFCSTADNCPFTVIESLASGTPVFAFDTGGIPEIVRDGKTGRIVPQYDIKGAAQAIRDAYRSNTLGAWSVAGRRDMEERYSEEKFIDTTIQYYRDIVTEHKKKEKAKSARA